MLEIAPPAPDEPVAEFAVERAGPSASAKNCNYTSRRPCRTSSSTVFAMKVQFVSAGEELL